MQTWCKHAADRMSEISTTRCKMWPVHHRNKFGWYCWRHIPPMPTNVNHFLWIILLHTWHPSLQHNGSLHNNGCRDIAILHKKKKWNRLLFAYISTDIRISLHPITVIFVKTNTLNRLNINIKVDHCGLKHIAFNVQRDRQWHITLIICHWPKTICRIDSKNFIIAAEPKILICVLTLHLFWQLQ